jgi:drug/metabolite transporter (DMT)-like permease
MKKILPTASVIAAGVLWGIISFFINALSAAGMSAMQITFVRMAVSAPLMLMAAAVICRGKLRLNLKDIWMFAGTGIVSIVLFNICYFYTMIHSEVSIAVVLLYTSPVFIMLISAVFFKEKITLSKLAALGMTFGGCVLVAGLSGGSSVMPFIVITGLASGLFYGLYTIFGRIALKKYDSLTVTVYTFIFGLIGSAPVGDAAGAFRIISDQPSLIFWCAGIGIFCTILPYFLYTWGLARMDPSKAAITVAVEPMVGAVIGMTFYQENSSPARLAGIALIIGALVVLNVKKPS